MFERLRNAVNEYRMSEETRQAVQATPFHMLSSVSGGGKGVIADALTESGRYEFFVTHTTRPRITDEDREEKDGEDYYFVSPEAMLELIERGVFIEVKIIHGEYVYGASVQELQRIRESGALPLHAPDVTGAQEILDISESANGVFIVPPSAEIWMERLLGRGPISARQLSDRIKTAISEIETVLNDKRFTCVINDDLEEAVQKVDEIFHEKENTDAYNRKARTVLKEIHEAIRQETFVGTWQKKTKALD